MVHEGGILDAGLVDRDRNLDLGGADHPDIDAGLPEGLEHLRGHPGVGTHADADHGKLGDGSFGFELGLGTEIGEDRFEGGLRPSEIVGMHREGMAGVAIVGDVRHDHVDVDLIFTEGTEDLGRHARFIGNAGDGDAGLGAFD